MYIVVAEQISSWPWRPLKHQRPVNHGSAIQNHYCEQIMCGRFTLKTQPSQWGQLLLPLVQEYGSRHPDWEHWNAAMRDHLVATQATSGHEKGSWHFPDRWGDIGGRLYTTAMCTLTLEVYYRYQPLYPAMDEFPL